MTSDEQIFSAALLTPRPTQGVVTDREITTACCAWPTTCLSPDSQAPLFQHTAVKAIPESFLLAQEGDMQGLT